MRIKRFNKLIDLFIEEETYNKIKEISNEKSISYSEYIREAIKEKLENEKNE